LRQKNAHQKRNDHEKNENHVRIRAESITRAGLFCKTLDDLTGLSAACSSLIAIQLDRLSAAAVLE
ncbi:unnamed protein product, partial [marine sediment metagenome]